MKLTSNTFALASFNYRAVVDASLECDHFFSQDDKRSRGWGSVAFKDAVSRSVCDGFALPASTGLRAAHTARVQLFPPQVALGNGEQDHSLAGRRSRVGQTWVSTSLEDEDCIMLARILKERDLMGSSIGTMAISCAAIDDISAWLLLAVLK
jgi:hypothetical protein